MEVRMDAYDHSHGLGHFLIWVQCPYCFGATHKRRWERVECGRDDRSNPRACASLGGASPSSADAKRG